MQNFSTNPASCRVDFFKPSGKWYTTEALEFHSDLWERHPADALRTACEQQLEGRLTGMIAVCLMPYVKNEFPVAIVVGGGNHLSKALEAFAARD